MSIEHAYRQFLELTGDAVAAASLAVGVYAYRSSDDLLTVSEVAAMLHISDDRIRDYIRRGSLRAYDLNHGGNRPHHVVKRSSVYEFLETLTVQPVRRPVKANCKSGAGDWA